MIQLVPIPTLAGYMLTRSYHATLSAMYGAGHSVRVEIPAGFTYDGASIPRVFWWLLFSPFDPCVMEAALLHDYCYRYHVCSRKEADTAFLWALRYNRATPWKAWTMFAAVRLFGGRRWIARNCGEGPLGSEAQ